MTLDRRKGYKTITINNFNAKLWDDFSKHCKKHRKVIKYEVEDLIKGALNV